MNDDKYREINFGVMTFWSIAMIIGVIFGVFVGYLIGYLIVEYIFPLFASFTNEDYYAALALFLLALSVTFLYREIKKDD